MSGNNIRKTWLPRGAGACEGKSIITVLHVLESVWSIKYMFLHKLELDFLQDIKRIVGVFI